jgi:hypothetical protein
VFHTVETLKILNRYMIPFTYLIHCTVTDQYYYGSRYGRRCHPSSLWTSYFTSSKVVKQLILEHGKDAFTVSVRKTFDTPEEARRWESKFLNKVKAAQSDKWLNQHNADEKFYCKGHHGNLGKKHTKEHNENISKGQRGIKRNPFSEEHRKKLSESRIGKPLSVETKQKLSNIRRGRSKILKLVICPHCGKSGKGGNMTRYHFDKCYTLLP